MGLILSSTINMPNDSPPALLIFEKCSKNSPVVDVLRQNYFLMLLQTFQKEVHVSVVMDVHFSCYGRTPLNVVDVHL